MALEDGDARYAHMDADGNVINTFLMRPEAFATMPAWWQAQHARIVEVVSENEEPRTADYVRLSGPCEIGAKIEERASTAEERDAHDRIKAERGKGDRRPTKEIARALGIDPDVAVVAESHPSRNRVRTVQAAPPPTPPPVPENMVELGAEAEFDVPDGSGGTVRVRGKLVARAATDEEPAVLETVVLNESAVRRGR